VTAKLLPPVCVTLGDESMEFPLIETKNQGPPNIAEVTLGRS
jgi:hypothetical protein